MGEIEQRGDAEALDYVLGELAEPDRLAFEDRLGREEDLRERVAAAEEIVVALRMMPPDGWSAVEPPPLDPLPGQVREPVDTVGREADVDVRWGPAPTPWWRRWPALAGGALAVLAAGLAIGVALEGGSGDDGSEPTPTAQVLGSSELRPAGPIGRGSSGTAAVVVPAGADEESLAVDVRGVRPSGPGRYYELWLMRGSTLVSLGGFRVGEQGQRQVEVPLPVDPADFRLIDISLERSDGGPGHSAKSILRGPVA